MSESRDEYISSWEQTTTTDLVFESRSESREPRCASPWVRPTTSKYDQLPIIMDIVNYYHLVLSLAGLIGHVHRAAALEA